jgi:hypothetical protein
MGGRSAYIYICVCVCVCVCRILLGKPKERARLRTLSIDGKTILKWILKTGWEGVEWIYRVQNRDK